MQYSQAEDTYQAELQQRSQTLQDNSTSTPLFQGLSEQGLQTLLQHSFIREFETGRVLYQQGDSLETLSLCFVLEGTVKTLRHNEEGEEAIMRLIGPGRTFMEAEIFMGTASPISAQVTEKARLLMIPESTVRHHVLQNNTFAMNLLNIVTDWYRHSMLQVDSMSIKSPVQRVGYYLLTQFLDRADSDSASLQLLHRKSAIANYLGIVPETFSRALNQLKKHGIDIEQNKIHLRDVYALCHFCDPDTAARCLHYGTMKCPYSESYG